MYFKENLARQIANEELRNVLVDGTTVHRPYRSSLIDQDYSRSSVITGFNALGGTDETLVVDKAKVVPFYVDALDKIENKWDMAMIYAGDSQRVLNNRIDQAILFQGTRMTGETDFTTKGGCYSAVTAQDLGGSGTGAATVSLSNVSNLFTVAGRQLDKFNRGLQSRYAVVGPRLKEIIKLGASGRETTWGDMVGASGLVGPRFGFDVYLSNNIPFTSTVTSSGLPGNGTYFYVDGVRFKWTTGSATDAGDVHATGTESTSYANLVLAINGTGEPGTATYIEVSDDDREQLRMGGIVASYTSQVLTLNGFGDVVISIGTTANVALTTNVQYPLFGIRGAIDFVALQNPNVEFRKPSNRLGMNVFAWTYYGYRIFTKEQKSLVRGQIDTTSWV